jgi:Radical SAM superfamily
LFPRSEAVIVSPGLRQLLFHFVMIKPTHYDDDGYPIQWFRSAIPSNTLACLNALAEDARGRNVLGPDVEIRLHTYDETNRRVQPDRIIREIRKAGGKALIGLVGVQSNQFPRAVDHARPFFAAGLPVCIGGFHISGCIAMLPEMPQDMREAQALGISFFAGEAEEGRFDEVLRDAWNGMLAPLYKLPNLQGEPPPILPRKHIHRTSGSLSSIDLGRGCPYQCSFCTIINVQGRKSRFRSPDDLQKIVRENCAQSIRRFFITDDNFARNRDWELLFDRLIELRAGDCPKIGFTIQVDTALPQDPEFHREGRAGRRPPGVHRTGERQSGQSHPSQETPEQDHRLPADAAEMARARRHHLCRLHHRPVLRWQNYSGWSSNPSSCAHQRKVFAASPVSCSVDAALRRRRIKSRVTGQRPIYPRRKPAASSSDRMKTIGVPASCRGGSNGDIMRTP